MGFDLKWIIACKDEKQANEIFEYMKHLYSIQWTDEFYQRQGHYLYGEVGYLYCTENWYFITGTCRDCKGCDVGYWIGKENKINLFENVLYYETGGYDFCIYQVLDSPHEENDEELCVFQDVKYICDYVDERKRINAGELSDADIPDDIRSVILYYNTFSELLFDRYMTKNFGTKSVFT